MISWKRDAVAGLVVLTPLVVVLLAIRWVLGRLPQLPLTGELPQPLPDFVSLVLVVAVVLGVGHLMRSSIGNTIENRLDRTMNRIPLVRLLYNASKLAIETITTRGTDLQHPVSVEPWPGMHLTAFKTGNQGRDGRELLFMPTSPNISTGFVIEVDSEDYQELDESMEAAFTRVLSAGLADTTEQRPVDRRDERRNLSNSDRGGDRK